MQTADTATAPRTSDVDTARLLAQQVAASADGVTWRKVTTLLDLFGAYRLTTDVRRRIADALSQANLIPKPPIEEVERFETVRLALDVDQDGRPDDPEDTRSRSISRLLPIDEVIVPTRRENGPRRADHHRSDQNDDAVPVLSRSEKNTDRQTDEGHER